MLFLVNIVNTCFSCKEIPFCQLSAESILDLKNLEYFKNVKIRER